MEALKKALMQKMMEIQHILDSMGEGEPMEHEISESGDEISDESKKEKELQEEERAPIVKDSGVASENIEGAKGRGPMSFKEKVKAFKR